MNDVEIQVQISGNWQTLCSTFNDPQYILTEFKNAKNRYPELRVRAVDKDGRMIDMMI
mgnify:CR=1 FL=1|jgi:hypothetical protein